MKDGQLFRVKVIKDKSDLPKEEGYYFCALKFMRDGIEVGEYGSEEHYELNNKELSDSWLREVNWYLIPEPEITDADIEEWANEQFDTIPRTHTERRESDAYMAGAKAVINGEIKKIEK